MAHMTLSQDANPAMLTELKSALQAMPHGKFERLVAALMGRLAGVSLAVAKSGFQHGGDAGTCGRQGRHLRVECKRYADSTPFSDRELLGEMDQALEANPGLEVWVLAATREVPEQLDEILAKKAMKIGVPVLIVDWKPGTMGALAALCCHAPDLLATWGCQEASRLALALQPFATEAICRLERDLQAWSPGFDRLRQLSQERLRRIWDDPRASVAALGQNASGGHTTTRVERPTVSSALDAWWDGPATLDSPAVVLGWDGVGKTWVTLSWLVRTVDQQPIILVIPASALAGMASFAETTIRLILAQHLYELSEGLQELAHWGQRLARLLARPKTEGPVLTLYLDGMNQEPSVAWLQFIKAVQGPAFSGLVRIVASTRPLHFEERLGQLRGLAVPATIIEVKTFDDSPGGELDQKLALEGMTRTDLHADLLEIARTPRLFNLVVRLKDRLASTTEITIYRLLWEYGRDTQGARAGRSFSEEEWQDWLRELAAHLREGVRSFSRRELSETAFRPDLNANAVFARLSDIIDGQFTVSQKAGVHTLKPEVVAHALGASLLDQLAGLNSPSFDLVSVHLGKWMDPITGLDERSEILRAAVSILLEVNPEADSPVAGVLVTAWLQTQNLPDAHRHEIAGLAPHLVGPLLDSIEHAPGIVNSSARLWAMHALRSLPRTPGDAYRRIVSRAEKWMARVSRDVGKYSQDFDVFEKRRAERFTKKLGKDVSGPQRVLGVDLDLVDSDGGLLAKAVPSLLEGYPLAGAIRVFELAAITESLSNQDLACSDLDWLCILNERDSQETNQRLRDLSLDLRNRPCEPGVDPTLPLRAAAVVLWMTGEEADDNKANEICPAVDGRSSYEDYLANPGHSLLQLERRHASDALADPTLSLWHKLQKTQYLWIDPSFEPPPVVAARLQEEIQLVEISSLDSSLCKSREDLVLEKFTPALARCSPSVLTRQLRAKFLQTPDLKQEAQYWRIIRSAEQFLLMGEAESRTASDLRHSGNRMEWPSRLWAISQLLMIELQEAPGHCQFETVMAAGLEHVLRDMKVILRPPTAGEAEALVERFGEGSMEQRRNLLALFLCVELTPR